ncbi:MAG: prepilin-type N-terminal cleavage/methylation domain-containing protein, partial [Planctomycetes bacterium]|nr:prepilin-type N-terminal cleavage/methylation domain-containing protein [Planctomycetota bacterium]
MTHTTIPHNPNARAAQRHPSSPPAGNGLRVNSRGRRAPGFTIIELLVAITVASLLLFMVNFIFNDAARTVSRGIALSDIIANTRGANDQFAIDASVMVGPSASPASEPGGFLVIANHEIDAKVRRGPTLGEEDVTVRADQLMFIRKRVDGGNLLLPISPEATSTFTADFERGAGPYYADHVKVWYGHVALTGNDGVIANGSGEGLGDGINRIANDWILGRHAMFLVDEDQGADLTNIYADSALWNADVNGYNPPTSLPSAVSEAVYAGLTDMAGQILGPESEAGSINADLAAATDTADYQARAYSYTYLPRRLWANDSPRIDTNDPLYTIAAWQVAQQHPIFMAHCSD